MRPGQQVQQTENETNPVTLIHAEQPLGGGTRAGQKAVNVPTRDLLFEGNRNQVGEHEAKSRVGVGVATFRYQSRMREQPWDSETCQRLTRQHNHTDPKTLRSGAARDT